jgi:large-conductance mechanosensitive channel
MVSYENAKVLYVENIDEPITFLGVPVSGLIGGAFGLILTLIVSPILAPIISVGICLFSKYVQDFEKQGNSLVYQKQVQRLNKKFFFIKELFPSLKNFNSTEDYYHGN